MVSMGEAFSEKRWKNTRCTLISVEAIVQSQGVVTLPTLSTLYAQLVYLYREAIIAPQNGEIEHSWR